MKIDIYYNEEKKSTEFKLGEPIVFKFQNEKKLHIIQRGFVSDGMSVPRFLWSIISPQIDSSTLRQSIIHDYMFKYKMGFFKSNWWYFKALAVGLNLFQRILVLIGLTLFGWTHY